MGNLRDREEWAASVRRIEPGDSVIGGDGAPINQCLEGINNRAVFLKKKLDEAVASIGKNKTDAENMFARKTTSVTAGAGLTGGGTLGGNMQFALGTPGTCSGNTTNWAGSSTHTHQLAAASPTVAGVAKLINNLITDDANSALSAAMGQKLNQEKLGNSGNQTLTDGMLVVKSTKANANARFALLGTGDGWLAEVGASGELIFTRRGGADIYSAAGNRAVYKMPSGTGTHVLATESQIGFVKPVIKPATSEIIDLTKKSEILAYAGTSGNKHIQLTFYNNASSQIVGLPIEDKSPCQMDISIMGAYTVCRVYYFYLRREFVSSGNWNSEELSYRWDETVNKNTAVMLAGNQEIRGKKTFNDLTDFARGLRISSGSQDRWFQLGFSDVAAFLKNPVSNKELRLGNDGLLNYQGDKIMLASDKSDAVNLDDTNKLATAKAVKIVNDKIANAVPSGAVIHFDLPTAPPGWYELNGAAVPVSACPGLVAARYVGNSANATAEAYYKCTNPSNPNGSRNVNGTHIKLPDHRGEFLRAWDHGRGVDAGRQLGSFQIDAIRNIKGQFQADDEVGVVTRSFGNDLMGAFRSERNHSNGKGHDSNGGGGDIVSFDASRVVPTASENRPRNIALMLCIKA